MGICFILGAMPVDKLPVQPKTGDFVIAADGGLENCRRLGLRPDLICGDFDSLGRVPAEENVVRVPVEKDDTDMALAARLGAQRGYNRFVLLGGTGGRPDHTLANYALLAHLSQTGSRAALFGDGWAASAITNSALDFPPGCEGTVSVFAWDTMVQGVEEQGLQYTLQDARLYSAVALGVSNAFLGQPARIGVKQGTLLVLLEQKAAILALHALLEGSK